MRRPRFAVESFLGPFHESHFPAVDSPDLSFLREKTEFSFAYSESFTKYCFLLAWYAAP
jgi:hypothetical protein